MVHPRPLCAHGFRSSSTTVLNRERVNGRRRSERDLVEMQQDRLDRLPERVELLQHWADEIDVMREGAIVLPLVD
ncbi:hypothetical protein [Bradyrhizobium sp. Tv2a-2]|uniref:hypothetical protein n=1 Tax=Bradyrhizobium sp. Tv2a-2 TaxID=113395 RepID=UPI0012EB7F5B|nr:hypothetical protein [Bradyrhizobium sp. Tv2a-2]